jgi:outer membrane protein
MTSALRLCAAAMIAALSGAPVKAADVMALAEPPPLLPHFYVHAGAAGTFFETNAQPTGGGVFGSANVAIRPVYTLVFETGYFITPNITIAISTGVPPIEHFKATGLPQVNLFGTNLSGSARNGSVGLMLQYHFTQFGALQPYFGAGGAYVFNFGNFSDGILRNFSIDQNFAFVLQAGADLMIAPNWGIFIDGKKSFYSTDAQGFLLNTNTPIRTHITLDPWRASAGITFKY